jgi:glycerophosphoryl diester phosphodiesterase
MAIAAHECVEMTRDDQLLMFHDLTLDRMTDVAGVFPGRARADGAYYVIDFTLAEVRQLQVSEARVPGTPLPLYPDRFPPGKARFAIHTLQEELELIDGLRRSTGRTVGIYAELKAPWFHYRFSRSGGAFSAGSRIAG